MRRPTAPLDRPETELAGQVALAVAGHASVRAIARAAVEQARKLGATSTMIHVFDPSRRVLELVADFGLGRCAGAFRTIPLASPLLVARAARSREIVAATRDGLGDRAQDALRSVLRATSSDFVAAAPFLARGALVGCATWTMATRRVYGDRERAKLASLTGLVGVALAAAQTLDRERAERARLTHVIRAAIDIVLACDSTSVLHAVAEQARTIAGAHVAAVGVHDGQPVTPAFVRWATSGGLDSRKRPQVTGAFASAALRGEQIEVFGAHPIAAISRAFPGDDVRRVLAVPLIHQRRSIGTLLLGRRGDAPAFTAGETDAVRLFAQYAAPAIELARSRESRPRLHDAHV